MHLIDTLAYWIEERERVRRLKEGGALPPWSKDPVFQTVYFCNIHREDDKTTRWIRQNWSYPEHSDFEFAMCLARLLNWPPSLEMIGFPSAWGWDLHEAVDKLRNASDHGTKIWGNAYVVTTHGRPMSKLDYLEEVCNNLLSAPLQKEVRKRKTLEDAHSYLLEFEGFGSFMAAQVVADLKNTEGHPLQFAEDWWNWSAPGPGSMRGLQWVYGRRVRVSEYHELMKDLHVAVEEKVYPIHMCEQDLQNCLCEFDKYMRVKTGAGRSKRKYNGSSSGG